MPSTHIKKLGVVVCVYTGEAETQRSLQLTGQIGELWVQRTEDAVPESTMEGLERWLCPQKHVLLSQNLFPIACGRGV